MRLGIDGRKIPLAQEKGPVDSMDHGHALGMEGLFFRTVLDMSPSLDPGLLSAVRQRADELGMYLETGLGKVNPYAAPETPELRAIGDGDTLLGFRRMMEACAAIGCRELWVGTANYKSHLPGRFACDRFRTDAPWADQLVAIRNFLGLLAPIARDLGIHINLETHEEITSWEVVRLVESLGPDAFGIVYDTSNGLQRGEFPAWACARVAAYVRQTHFKDVGLFARDGGLVAQARACGEGVVDYPEILRILGETVPGVNISIECQQVVTDPVPPVLHVIELRDPDWRSLHPDLTDDEVDAVEALARTYETRVVDRPDLALEEDARVFDYEAAVSAIARSKSHLLAHWPDSLRRAAG